MLLYLKGIIMKRLFANNTSIQKSTLLLIMFIDGLGMSLVLPLLGQLFSTGSNSMLSSLASSSVTSFYYCASLVAFSGMMIIGASVLAQLSDNIGRKPTLRIALLGAIAGYLICALAVFVKMPLLFLTGRIIDGLTAGSIPVAQAIMTDLDSNDNKMTSIGLVMFAVTSGYMFGPLFASIGFVGAQHNLTLPFLLIAGLCCVSLILLHFVNDTFKPSRFKFASINLLSSFKQIGQLISQKSLRHMLLCFLLFQCAWTLFYQYIPLIHIAGQNLTGPQASIAMTIVGIAMCLGFCVAVPKLQGKMTPKRLAYVCLCLFCLFSVCYFIKSMSFIPFQMISVALAMLYTVGYSSILAYLLSIADDNQTGLVLGSVASICAISATISALMGSSIGLVDNTVFFTIQLTLCLICLGLFTFNFKSKTVPTKT